MFALLLFHRVEYLLWRDITLDLLRVSPGGQGHTRSAA